MAKGYEGLCVCGEVGYRMNSTPLFVHACHCTECHRLSGGASAINALIETDRVETLAGAAEPVPVTGTSGKPQTIYRYPRGGVALWSHYLGAGRKFAFVRVGTLDEPARLPPDIHIFTSSKLPWVELPDGVPAAKEYHSARGCWPPESLKRRARLRATGREEV